MMALMSAGVLAGSLLASRAAEAHAVMTSPVPRTIDNGGETTGPCGTLRMANQPVTNPALVPGATLSVTWNETITHPGCFVVDFSAANDQGFVQLATVAHIPGQLPAGGRPYSATVTLPTTPCPACTLRVRQFQEQAEPASIAACMAAQMLVTYYSCANVVLAADGGTGTGGATGTGGRAGTGGATGTGGAIGGTGGRVGGTGGRTGTGGTVGGSGGSNPGTGGAVVTGSGGATVLGTGGTTSPGTGGAIATGTGGATEGTGGSTGAPGATDSSGGCSCDTVATAPVGLAAVLVGLGALLTLMLRRRRGRS